MPIHTEFHDGILRLSIAGLPPRGEVVEIFLAACSDPRFTAETAVLIDARESQANPSSADLHEYARRIIRRCPVGYAGKWAVVVRKEPLQFGLGRMGALTMESAGIPMAAFTEMDAALTYLKSEK
jgi:hypothetical protein